MLHIKIIHNFASIIIFNAFLFIFFLWRKEVASFFKSDLHEDFTFSDYQEFVSLWFIVIMSSDVLTIVGSVYKMVIDQKVISDQNAISPFRVSLTHIQRVEKNRNMNHNQILLKGSYLLQSYFW